MANERTESLSAEEEQTASENPSRETPAQDYWTRTPREGRDERPSDAWVPDAILPSPTPRDGWVFRWIRSTLLDKSDNKNVSRRFREGWEPVAASQVPELKIKNDLNSQWPDCVEVGGLLLCRAPEEMVKRRRDHLDQKNDLQMRSVDEDFMRENNPNMKKFADKETRVTFGSGR